MHPCLHVEVKKRCSTKVGTHVQLNCRRPISRARMVARWRRAGAAAKGQAACQTRFGDGPGVSKFCCFISAIAGATFGFIFCLWYLLTFEVCLVSCIWTLIGLYPAAHWQLRLGGWSLGLRFRVPSTSVCSQAGSVNCNLFGFIDSLLCIMSLKRTRDSSALDSECAIGSHILSCMHQATHAFSNNIKMPWERQFVGPWDRAVKVLTLAKPVKDLQTQ